LSTVRIIARNILSNWLNLAVMIVISFAMMPFLIHNLGESLYGIWTLLISIVGYGNLLDFGVRTAIVKYVSEHHATGNQDRLCRLFTTTLFLYTTVGILIFLVTIFTSAFLLTFFHVPSESLHEAKLVLIIVGSNLALKFPGSVFEGFLTGLQRYEITNGINIIVNMCRAVLIVIFIINGAKLLALAIIMLICDVLMTSTTMLMCLRFLPWLKIRKSYLSGEVIKEVYAYGIWSFVIMVAGRIIYESDSVLIGLFLPISAITHFAVAANLVRYLRQLGYSFGNVFTPAASSLEAKNEHEKLETMVIYGTRYALLTILPVAVFVAIMAYDFLNLWIGTRFASESGSLLIILSLSQAINVAQAPAASILFGLNQHRWLGLIGLGEAFLKLTISIILIPILGILGAALGTAIPQLISSLLIPILTARLVKISLKKYFKESFFLPLLIVLIAGSLVFVLRFFIEPVSWILLIFEVLVGFLVYIFMVIRYCLNSQQRRSIYKNIYILVRKFGVDLTKYKLCAKK